MIYELIKTAISAVEALGNQVYPVSANLDGKTGPIALYSFGNTVPYRCLGGKIVHYTETVNIQILTDDFDSGQALYFAVCAELHKITGQEDSGGNRVLRVSCQSTEPDSYAIEIAKNVRSLQAEIVWAPG